MQLAISCFFFDSFFFASKKKELHLTRRIYCNVHGIMDKCEILIPIIPVNKKRRVYYSSIIPIITLYFSIRIIIIIYSIYNDNSVLDRGYGCRRFLCLIIQILLSSRFSISLREREDIVSSCINSLSFRKDFKRDLYGRESPWYSISSKRS